MNRFSLVPDFWGPLSPLTALWGLALLIMAGSRTAFALVILLALLWVYGLSALVYVTAGRFFPAQGKNFILVFLSAFFGSLFLFLIWLLNPLLALELGFLIILVPVCCIGSGVFTRLEVTLPGLSLIRALEEAALLGLLILALALIREPLGYVSLSLPGGPQGIVEILKGGEGEGFFPAHIAASVAGGFLLLGYGLAIFRHFQARYAGGEDER